eukprot:gnl/MRDRNA2_/MRDRNA2_125445_c0_seq1.p1 gnl/MRDRNA2_/MRDRNA2_125445_c0~~gnl/MRDRNA2_/MRDRNA2_125445_c0_seq1.p1  ORF type:complete len:522 (-),score=135.83 gnl/MRDRNA2_/MRDRNA2_125445_c0_seq1:60-1625(-)
MPGPTDYKKWDNFDCSSDEEGPKEPEFDAEEDDRLLAELPVDLSRELQLILAAKENQQHIVKLLLDRGVSVNALDPKEMTALHRAVQGGVSYRKSIEFLIEKKADINLKTPDGQTALSLAAKEAPPEMSALLLECSSPSDETLRGALIEAAANKNAGVQRLLAPKVTDTTCCDAHGRTALHCAAQHGDVDGLQMMSARSSSDWLESRDGEGETVLMSAVRGGQADTVQWLFERKADVNAQATESRSSTAAGGTALMIAAEFPNREVGTKVGLQLLQFGATAEAKNPVTGRGASSALIHAVCTEKVELCGELLNQKASLDADPGGRHALPCAAQTGNTALCKLLLDAKASVNARSRSGGAEGAGVAALLIAVAMRNIPLATLLLEYGASPEDVDERLNTPLMLASKSSTGTGCAEVLLQHRADVDVKHEQSGKTALLLAAAAGHLDFCALLLRHGADVNTAGVSGATALLAAAANGHADVCHKLFEFKAAVDVEMQGRKAWDFAESAGNSERATQLKAYATG